ncbi:MAG: RAMP superfamily CRISPR-associated protein [Paraglaciecola sp.]|nr:RAMP superfamily CRISPR-associated protein [Paraglaciecola sp.]
MLVDRFIFHYAVVELEATTPHAIQSGRGDTTHDVLLMRDHNGLPALPGTSIAGVLRNLYNELYQKEGGKLLSGNELFGYADSNGGRPSWVQFAAGLIHNSKNEPQEGLKANLAQDPILVKLLDSKPLVRQRVRLNEKGAAIDMGKFDNTLVPAGVRYSTLISYWSDGSAVCEQAFENILSLLNSPTFRLGHSTRSGSGGFKVNRVLTKRWDLKQPKEARDFQQYHRSRCNLSGLQQVIPTVQKYANWSTVELKLQAEAGWRIGGGEHSFSLPDVKGKVPDLLPQSEYRIQWQNDKASLCKQQPVLPASAVKGAIAHRFVFHYRRISGDFVQPKITSSLQKASENLGVREVFGFTTDGDNPSAHAGRLLINDIYIEDFLSARQMHNKIDRFTGGVVTGALFEEEVLWQTPLTLQISILKSQELSVLSREALLATFRDLEEGLLPLGASGSRGQGIFTAITPLQWLVNPLEQQKDALA